MISLQTGQPHKFRPYYSPGEAVRHRGESHEIQFRRHHAERSQRGIFAAQLLASPSGGGSLAKELHIAARVFGRIRKIDDGAAAALSRSDVCVQ